jgi:hypothetical protein
LQQQFTQISQKVTYFPEIWIFLNSLISAIFGFLPYFLKSLDPHSKPASDLGENWSDLNPQTLPMDQYCGSE